MGDAAAGADRTTPAAVDGPSGAVEEAPPVGTATPAESVAAPEPVQVHDGAKARNGAGLGQETAPEPEEPEALEEPEGLDEPEALEAPEALEEPEGSESPPGESSAASSGERAGPPLRLYIAGLTVAAVLLAAATGLLAVTLRRSSDADQQRSAALLAARQEAGNLTNLSQQAGGRDFDAVLAGSAGELKQQLAGGRSAFIKALQANSVTSSGTVLDAGIVSISPTSATVLLNVKATLRNKQASAPQARSYHWQAGMVYSGGRWLMTSLEFV